MQSEVRQRVHQRRGGEEEEEEQEDKIREPLIEVREKLKNRMLVLMSYMTDVFVTRLKL